MGGALVEHRVALLAVCVASLLAGVPLAINMFWHLQVKYIYCITKKSRDRLRDPAL